MRKRYSCWLIFFLSCYAVSGQDNNNPRRDSLEVAFTNATEDTVRIRIYHQLAATCAENQVEDALQYEYLALALAQKIEHPESIAETYTNIGALHRHHSDYFKAIPLYKKAIAAAGSPDEWYLTQTYLELGIAYLRMSRLDSAKDVLNKALETNRKKNNRHEEASIYNMLGNVLKDQNDYKQSLEYYLKSTSIFESISNKQGLTQSISNVGNLMYLMGDYDKALDYASQSLTIAEEIDKRSSIAYSNRLIGRIYRKQGKYDEALQAYANAIKIYQSLGAKRDISETHYNAGNIYYEKLDFQKATEQYKAALAIQRAIPDSFNMAYSYSAIAQANYELKQRRQTILYMDSSMRVAKPLKLASLQMDIYDFMSAFYSEQNDYKSAYRYHQLYTNLKDSLDEIRNREDAAELEARYQNEKKENEIRTLNAANEMKALQRNYLIGISALFLLLVVVLYNRYKIKLKTSKKLEELDHIKSRFFANISHEFRTPLTLITGPLEKRLAETKTEDERHDLELMHRNARRLHNLINQMLDLSKIESGNMTLRVSPLDLSQFLSVVCSSFHSLSEQKGIRYVTEIAPGIKGFADPDKLEKILYNLLSNAFKFTGENGIITVTAEKIQQQLIVRVKDTGIGIARENLDHIFDRFYQVDNSTTRPGPGTGIGLALAKELATLHGGTLTVSSVVNEGSEFGFTIPIEKNAYKNEDIHEAPIAYTATRIPEPVRSTGLEDRVPANEDLPLILVAEDNTDMQTFITKTLHGSFQVAVANDGEDAWKKALESVPDLVISDLMMPRMDGKTLCGKIKTHEATSHIPVIMLTAKADHTSKIEGLQTGADDYLTKPFNATELTVRVRNLIEQRKKLRELFRQEIRLQPTDKAVTPPDAAFMKKVMALLEENHVHPTFGVEEFTREAGLSRMQLHRKLKALTGKSPGEFLREFRINRAKQLLLVKGIQVSEVAYQVGFNNPSNFTKSFKDVSGVTPSEFIEKNN